ncbi:MAG: LiaI-LiaF-like domain-containing protein [Bacteroidota bacterium]
MEIQRTRSRLPRLLLGTAFITLGGLLILDNIGIFEWSVWKLWPLTLVLMGLVRLIQSDDIHGRRLGVWWIVVGAWLQVSTLRLFGLTFHESWPILIIAVGVMMLWKHTNRNSRTHFAKEMEYGN